jgi:hypothetical protein
MNKSSLNETQRVDEFKMKGFIAEVCSELWRYKLGLFPNKEQDCHHFLQTMEDYRH